MTWVMKLVIAAESFEILPNELFVSAEYKGASSLV